MPDDLVIVTTRNHGPTVQGFTAMPPQQSQFQKSLIITAVVTAGITTVAQNTAVITDHCRDH